MECSYQLSDTRIDIKLTRKRLGFLAKRNGKSVKDIQEYLGLACSQPVYRWFKGIILPSAVANVDVAAKTDDNEQILYVDMDLHQSNIISRSKSYINLQRVELYK